MLAEQQIFNRAFDPNTDSIVTKEDTEHFFAGGKKTISDADNVEPLSAISVPCSKVWIQAISENTKPIHFGTIENLGDSTPEVTNDWPDVAPGDNIIVNVNDLAKIYIKVEVDNEGCKRVAIG